jgi:diguanylate cyclase (GGDEF)-like protein
MLQAGARRPVLSAAIALILAFAPPAAAKNLRFARLSLEQGLSQNNINAILQDRNGLMWFGTQDGLNRFDGYRFVTFKHDPHVPESLSNDWIWALHEDREGTLWIGTDGGGLNRLDADSETFTALRSSKDDPKSLSSDRVRALLEARNGVLWVGTDGAGLNRFDRATQTFVRFRHDPKNPDSLSSDRIRGLLEDRSGLLWIATDGGGLNRLDPATGRVQRYRHDPADPRSLSHDRVRTVLEDRDGAIWAATYQGGLNRLERGGRFERFQHDAARPGTLADDRLRALYQDRSGTLWVGSDAGLDEWAAERGFVNYRHDPTDPQSLSDDRVTAVFQDRGGVLWVGTAGTGINRWNMATQSFALHRVDPKAPSTLSNNTVQAFATEGPDVVWIGTYAGLNRLDRRTGVYTHYRHDPKNPSSISDDRVMSLLVDRTGRLWAGTLEGGLNLFDRARGTFKRYRHEPKDDASLAGNGITTIREGQDGSLWLGIYRGGLNRFDPATGKVTHRFRHDPGNPSSLADDTVFALHEDAGGTLWVGLLNGGLDRLDRAAGGFTHHRHDPARPDSLGHDTVFSVHEDRHGTLWVGTQAGGLARWDAADRQAGRAVFRNYGERDGLPNDNVYGILEDDAGDLWLSTNRGLSRLDPRAQSFRNFDASHGLARNEFNFGAYHRAATGEMFFGTNGGFSSFVPERVIMNAHVPEVVLTSFQKLNQEVPRRDVPAGQDVLLTHRDYVVSFEFAALDYAAPERNRYAYRLEGLDRDWVQAGAERRATYTNLAPGRYLFRVKAANGDGVWNENGLAMNVRVLPPPWRTWWAYAIYVLLVAAAVGRYVRRQAQERARADEYRKRLETEVRERTAELAQRNDELQKMNLRLEDVSLTDSLTGLNNRRFLTTQIQQDVALVDRYYRKLQLGVEIIGEDRPDFALMMIDLDGLKGVNDFYGHAAGDQALVQMRDILERACRKSDTIVRWGGDEFLVLARYAEGDIAAALAERIRRAVEEHSFELSSGGRVHLRCSIGWAMYPLLPNAPRLVTWEQVGTIADRALYAAKSSGRNAWVGLISTLTTPVEETVHVINQRPQVLLREGALEVRSSLTSLDSIVWDRNVPTAREAGHARGKRERAG